MAVLAASYDTREQAERLWIDDEGLICSELLKVLPAYGGGQYLYVEQATVHGIVVAEPRGGVRLQFVSCQVVRDEYVVDVQNPEK